MKAVGSAIDQLDDKPKLAMPSAPEEVDLRLSDQTEKKCRKKNEKDAMLQYTT